MEEKRKVCSFSLGTEVHAGKSQAAGGNDRDGVREPVRGLTEKELAHVWDLRVFNRDIINLGSAREERLQRDWLLGTSQFWVCGLPIFEALICH